MSYQLGEIILQVNNIKVEYDNKIILDHVNLEERDVFRNGKTQGQVIAILGRSGRGKSTLFRVMAGLEKPESGEVLIGSYDKENHIHLSKITEGKVGFVNQKYTLFRHKTIKESLSFAMRNSSLSSSEKNEKISSHLADWGLEKFKNQYPNELSGGQRQRTAILEQLLCSEHFIILDEPFSGLDIGNIEMVRESFNYISSSNELNTIIFSTHDIELAIELADSIYILGHQKTNEGHTTSYGTITKHFDLKKLGISWKEESTKDHYNLFHEIKKELLLS